MFLRYLTSTAIVLMIFTGCTTAPRYGSHRAAKVAVAPASGSEIIGMASFYGYEFGGRPTASGEIFDPMLLTAAHRQWAFGTTVEVTNLETSKTVVVRINDRGPFTSCIIDLSYGAAQKIGMVQNTKVKMKIISTPPGSK